MSLINNLFFALFFTIVIELVVAFLFGFRKKIELITIVLVNLVTNPILNYFLLVNDYFSFWPRSMVLIIFLEVLIVLLEWRLLVYVRLEKTKKLLLLSALMNFCSYVVGVIIFR